MFRLRRWYNQNRKTIWQATAIIVFCILIIQVLNYFAGQKNTTQNTNISTENSIKDEYTDLSLSTDKSVLSNEKISSSKSDSIETINTFFSYCNEGNVEKAYNLLTDECKELMYPKLSDFKESYYKAVFNGEKKNISLENWTGDIYKAEISDDALSTGGYDEDSTRQDYITVKKVEENYKLNINNYVNTTEINITKVLNSDIEITVNKKDEYMDYEVYYFTIKNNLDNPILLDNLENVETIYLEDKNNIEYSAYTHEVSTSELLVNARETKTIKIKFYNKYISGKRIEKVVFSKVIIDYNSYKNLKNKRTFDDYYKASIEIQ